MGLHVSPLLPPKKPNNFKKNCRTITTKPQDTKMSQMYLKAVDGVERLVTVSIPRNRTAFLATVRQAFYLIPCEVHTEPRNVRARAHISIYHNTSNLKTELERVQ